MFRCSPAFTSYTSWWTYSTTYREEYGIRVTSMMHRSNSIIWRFEVVYGAVRGKGPVNMCIYISSDLITIRRILEMCSSTWRRLPLIIITRQYRPRRVPFTLSTWWVGGREGGMEHLISPWLWTTWLPGLTPPPPPDHEPFDPQTNTPWATPQDRGPWLYVLWTTWPEPLPSPEQKDIHDWKHCLPRYLVRGR